MDTIEDKELDEILEQRKEAKELAKIEEHQHEVVQPKFEQTNFGKKMDDVNFNWCSFSLLCFYENFRNTGNRNYRFAI